MSPSTSTARPSAAPGTGTSAGAAVPWQAAAALRELAGINMVGGDIVEVSPLATHRRHCYPGACGIRTDLLPPLGKDPRRSSSLPKYPRGPGGENPGAVPLTGRAKAPRTAHGPARCKLAQITQRFEFLEARLNAGAPPAEIARISREYSELKPVAEEIAAYRQALTDFGDAEAMLADPEMKALAEEEIPPPAFPKWRTRLPCSAQDAADARPAIIEIRPGTGARSQPLRRRPGPDVSAPRRTHGLAVRGAAPPGRDLGGVKEFTAHVQGEGVYARLKYESGVHRVQRVPETEAGPIHTSAATVAVLPEAEEVDIDPAGDIRIDTMCPRGQGAACQHHRPRRCASPIPSGIVVTSSEKSQHQNRAMAMQVLKSARPRDGTRPAGQRTRRRPQGAGGSGDRSERIRTTTSPGPDDRPPHQPDAYALPQIVGATSTR